MGLGLGLCGWGGVGLGLGLGLGWVWVWVGLGWACVGLGIDPERNGARVGHGSGNCELARTRRPDVPPVRSVNAGPGVPSDA